MPTTPTTLTTTTPITRTRLAACAALVLAAVAPAQADKLPKWRIDSYTKNKPEALAQLGYVSYGPFEFGTKGAAPALTSTIDDHLEHVQILWIETAHFRIGVDLPEWPVPMDPEFRAKIRRELEQLQQRLPSVNPKARVLDRWLRAHLVAQRLEGIYAEFQQLAGVTDADFPADQSKVVRMPGARFMGYGPYVGMRQKYLVLLIERLGPYQRYLKDFIGRSTKFPQKWHFTTEGSLMFAAATECDDSVLKDDTALHCALAFNVGQNLLDGFRQYGYDLPIWIREGFAHWMLRRVNPRFNQFDQDEGGTAEMKKVWRWEPYCRNLVASGGKFAPFPEVASWREWDKLTFNDHVAIWSRMDWLMSQGKEKWSQFLFKVKGRVDENWSPDQNDLVGAVREALQEVYGVSVLDFDRRWGEWVKATYPTQ
jgi:hypothetical protein